MHQVLGWDMGFILALLWQVPSEVLETPGLVAARAQWPGSASEWAMTPPPTAGPPVWSSKSTGQKW